MDGSPDPEAIESARRAARALTLMAMIVAAVAIVVLLVDYQAKRALLAQIEEGKRLIADLDVAAGQASARSDGWAERAPTPQHPARPVPAPGPEAEDHAAGGPPAPAGHAGQPGDNAGHGVGDTAPGGPALADPEARPPFPARASGAGGAGGPRGNV